METISDKAACHAAIKAAAYFAAAAELEDAYYLIESCHGGSPTLAIHDDYLPSAAFDAAAVSYANSLSRAVESAIAGNDDAEDSAAWASAACGDRFARWGWWHRIANLMSFERRTKAGGYGDDNEHRLIMSAIRASEGERK